MEVCGLSLISNNNLLYNYYNRSIRTQPIPAALAPCTPGLPSSMTIQSSGCMFNFLAANKKGSGEGFRLFVSSELTNTAYSPCTGIACKVCRQVELRPPDTRAILV